MRQRTLAREVKLEGAGLHTGQPCRLRLGPAPPDSGWQLRRVDVRPPVTIPVGPQAVVAAPRCTALGVDGVQVMTVEHLFAALSGLAVDNVAIEVDGPEVPALDNSALPFVQAVLEAGLQDQPAPRRVRRLRRAVWVLEAERGQMAVAMPCHELRVAYAFVSDRPALEDQYGEFAVRPQTFARELAPARTVAFLDEVQELRRRGLGLGGTADSVVLVGPQGYAGPLRFADEVVRHKILDLVGDLALAGAVRARVLAVRSGHRLHHQLARRILQESLLEPEGMEAP